jgi:hypothetical protein
VAFVAHVAGHSQIFVRLVGRGTSLQITRDPADHLYPRRSPDSASLFYYSDSSIFGGIRSISRRRTTSVVESG